MKERGFPFKAEMVRAILNGSKTQARWPIEPQPSDVIGESMQLDYMGAFPRKGGQPMYKSPFGVPGDQIWVRERCYLPPERFQNIGVQYPADVSEKDLQEAKRTLLPLGWKSRPSTNMPRWASRIDLLVKKIWVERVRDISETNARLEGVARMASYVTGFAEFWDSIYAAKGFGWDANPWVWVIEFERIRP